MQTIVIGHKNPDMDSICSAIAYAELKRLNNQTGVIAARAGNTNERIDFVLGKFGVEPPPLINDLSPRVNDVMEKRVISVGADSPVYDALQLIDKKRLRGLPVVDENNRCLGLLSAFMVSHHLFPPREEAGSTRLVTASLADIVTTFGGALVSGSLSAEPEEQFLMVGAMAQDSFAPRLAKYKKRNVVLFVGDRPHIQQMAIDARVHAIVVTGGLAIDEEIRAKARAARVTMISSPHDTATSVLLARGAVRVGRMIETDYQSFEPDTLLETARQLAAQSAAFIFPVIDEGGKLVGILSKSDFLKDIPRQLILVDHNELAQAVKGADKVPIVEILDHHKLGGFSSDTPILFWNNPVGSTSSIVTMCYQQYGIPVPPRIAGLLMSGIVADTLNLTSPTTTPSDCDLLNRPNRSSASARPCSPCHPSRPSPRIANRTTKAATASAWPRSRSFPSRILQKSAMPCSMPWVHIVNAKGSCSPRCSSLTSTSKPLCCSCKAMKRSCKRSITRSAARMCGRWPESSPAKSNCSPTCSMFSR